MLFGSKLLVTGLGTNQVTTSLTMRTFRWSMALSALTIATLVGCNGDDSTSLAFSPTPQRSPVPATPTRTPAGASVTPSPTPTPTLSGVQCSSSKGCAVGRCLAPGEFAG